MGSDRDQGRGPEPDDDLGDALEEEDDHTPLPPLAPLGPEAEATELGDELELLDVAPGDEDDTLLAESDDLDDLARALEQDATELAPPVRSRAWRPDDNLTRTARRALSRASEFSAEDAPPVRRRRSREDTQTAGGSLPGGDLPLGTDTLRTDTLRLGEDTTGETPSHEPTQKAEFTEAGTTELGLTEYELTELVGRLRDDGPRGPAIQPPQPFEESLSSLDEEVDDAPTEALEEVELDEPVDLDASGPLMTEELPELRLDDATMELHLDDATMELQLDDATMELHLDPERPEEAPAPAPAPPSLPEIPWTGLHPASLVVNLVPRTWRTLSGLWPLFLALLLGGRSIGFSLSDGLFLVLFLASGVASTVVHFLTLRYRVFEGRLHIRQGLLNRQARIIDPARIQNVAMIRNPFHAMSGLVEVRLETAGDVRTEGMLSALSVADAEALMRALEASRGRARPAAGPVREDQLLRLGMGELLAYGLSSGSAGLVALLLAGGMQLATVVDPDGAGEAIAAMPPGRAAAFVLLAFAVSWAASAVAAVLRHHGFTLSRRDDGGVDGARLTSAEGLLTRRVVEVPLRKVQMVMTDEPLVRRWMGYGTVQIETAGLGSVKDGVTAAELVVPMVESEALGQVGRLAIPSSRMDPWAVKLRPAHPRALFRSLLAGSARALLVSLPLVALAWPWGLMALWLLPMALLTNWLDWRMQGWLVDERVVVARRGFWRRRTWLLARDKLQSAHLVQGPLMRGYGLGRLVVKVAGSSVVLPDVAFDEGVELLERLRPDA